MKRIQPKKKLGQHFLREPAIAENIAKSLGSQNPNQAVVEVGSGTGALTDWLVKNHTPLFLVEIDHRVIPLLKQKYGDHAQIIEGDFLKIDLKSITNQPIKLIGNFPYNISSQLFFAIIENKEQISEVVCMVQEEVALRITSPPGNKTYGLLSVLLQAYFTTTYLFQVPATAFDPPPKVVSGVIKLTRKPNTRLDCDEKAFFKVVKAGFQQRRKMLRNALRCLGKPLEIVPTDLLTKRAEALDVEDFVTLTQLLFPSHT